MPRVPTYDNMQVAQGGQAPVAVQGSNGPSAGMIAAQRTQELGAGLARAGDTASRIALDAQTQINQVQVNDAVNKARVAVQNLAYDKDTGYLTLKGENALTRPSGQALPEEYGGKLAEQLSSISSGLGNDAQRRQFDQTAGDLKAQFHGQVEQHLVGEFMSHANSVDDASMNLAQNDARMNWNNPDRIFGRTEPDGVRVGGSIDAVKGAAMNKAMRNGLTGAPAQAAMLAAVSGTHTGVILAALENKNPAYAKAYLEKASKAGEMSADDILKVKGHVDQQANLGIAQGAVQAATVDAAPAIAPTGFDRMVRVVMSAESGGQRYDKSGGLLTSPAGAKGEMQVMDGTNKNPGLGVTPAKDDGPDERARVGRDYLQALLQRYGGDPGKAMAAYNAGFGNVDKAVADATRDATPGAWLDKLAAYQSADNHKQTTDYVAKNLAQLQGSVAIAPRPTELEFMNSVLAKLPPGASPQLVQLTREQAAQQFAVINRSMNELGNNALSEAQRWLSANKGDMANMPPQLKDAVDRYAPGKSDDLIKYGQVFALGENPTDLKLYNRLAAHPDEMARMTDAQFEGMKAHLSSADFKHFANERANYLNGKTDESAGAINTTAMNASMNPRLAGLGISATPSPKDTAAQERVGGIRLFVRNSLFEAQRQAGKKFTADEVEQHIDRLFLKDATFKNTVFGFTTGHSTENVMGMQLKDIPPDSVTELRTAFAKRGKPNPTTNDLVNAYRTWKLSQTNE